MNDESVVFHIIVIQTEIMIKASKGRKRWTMFNRALALEDVNAKCKLYLAFQAPKCIAPGNVIAKYCKFFCNSAK